MQKNDKLGLLDSDLDFENNNNNNQSSSSNCFCNLTRREFFALLFSFFLVCACTILVVVLITQHDSESCDYEKSSKKLYENLSINRMLSSLKQLDKIAYSTIGGNRAVGTEGYQKSVDYITSQLRKYTNYEVEEQFFTLEDPITLSDSKLEELEPENLLFEKSEVGDFTYSGSGDITGLIISIDEFGCEDSNFINYQNQIKNETSILLIRRGNCSFFDKAKLTEKYGGKGLLIYNIGDTDSNKGVVTGTLGEAVSIPVLGISYDVGSLLATQSKQTRIVFNMFTNTTILQIKTQNIIARSGIGSKSKRIIVGSHLDSVPAGPGINDNGSGSSLNLELAIESYNLGIKWENEVSFCWWAAEELGLLGSEYFVKNATATGEIKNIAVNLNFDMQASPNNYIGIYDGKNAENPAIRPQSATIEQVFKDFYDSQNLNYVPKAFDGRSDYGPFISANPPIPAGGISAGVEVVKTMEERTLFGGIANAPFDPCYHKACDSFENINSDILIIQAQAAAYTLETLATQSNLDRFLGTPTTSKQQQQQQQQQRSIDDDKNEFQYSYMEDDEYKSFRRIQDFK